MSKRYPKILVWDNANKWIPINRLSNHELVNYLTTRKTEIEKAGDLAEWIIPAETIVDMAKLAVRRNLTPPTKA